MDDEEHDAEYAYLDVEEEGWGGESEEFVLDESILTEYDPEDFISTAIVSLNSTIPVGLFEFEHSYGYDCQKYFNLCACDDAVVCWAAGSIVTFMDVNSKQIWFRRSSTGGSIGNITSHRQDPNYRIAVAEAREGDKEPIIIVYTWPQMDMDAVLREGTENAYAVLDFSPDGELLASVGKEPDFNLTIWNWKRHKIMLRTSAFTYGVNTVMFSPYCPGQLTTAGAAHIKFWKMAQTFTGLKLKGELGRFGKTEICDVLGVYPMPDEKVLSGCEWGNVLVWEAGLVKLEVTQRGRKTCHKAPVIQFMLSPAGDEVTTIARDGCIRAWYWDTVEQADPPEDDQYVELNPVAETCVPGCQIMSLRHQKDMFWYAQDGNGGIWTVELELDKTKCTHTKVMTSHAGAVIGMISLRGLPILLSAGADGALIAYNTEQRALVARYMFPTAISCMFYPTVDVDPTSKIIILGFSDGIIRTLMLHPEMLEEAKGIIDTTIAPDVAPRSAQSEPVELLDMISLLKPHSRAVVQITVNEPRTLLVTCGRDSTIFMYKLTMGKEKEPFTLDRLGYIETVKNIEFLLWKPGEEFTLLMCGELGYMMEAVLPDQPVREYSEITTFRLDYESFKEITVKKQFMQHRPFPQEEDLASIDEEALKAAAEISDRDKDDEEEWIGEIELIEDESAANTTITWAQYTEDGETIWVVQGGTGALLLVKPGSNKILKYAPFPNAWLETITSLKFVLDGRYLVVGTNIGYIRVVRMPTESEDNPELHLLKWLAAQQKLHQQLKGRRLAKEEVQPIPRIDFFDNYYMQMHDRYTGAITCLEFSGDGKYLYTCGADGNIFSYVINFEEPLLPPPEIPMEIPEISAKKIPEPSTLEGELMSHEQLKQKEEYDKMMAIANAHKKRVRDQLSDITAEYTKLIKANRMLPVSQQIDVTLDPRPLEVQEMELDEAKALTIRKIAHQLEASDIGLHKMYHRNIVQLDVFPFTLKAIRDPKTQLRPLRQKNLSQEFWDQLDEVYRKMAEAASRMRRTESIARRAAVKRMSWGPPRVASFLLGLPPRPPHQLKKAIRNYYIRLHRHHIQFIEWQEHLSRKPDPNAMPPGGLEALKEAEATIGNRLLKTSPDYVAPPGHNTQLRLCLTRQEIYEMKHEFNEKVLELREHKVQLVGKMRQIGERLAEIRAEIPAKMVKPPPAIPTIDEDLEFPEENLEVKPEPLQLMSRGTLRKKNLSEERRRSTVSSLYPQPRIRQAKVPSFMTLAETKPLAATWEILKPKLDQESTPVETEIRNRRIERHLYEQDMLLADAEVAVQKFDSRLRQLQRERIRVQEKNQLLELHLYQLHREMNVLNRFENQEDRLAERVYQKLIQVKAIQEQIRDCEQRIEEYRAEKIVLDLGCQDLQMKFKKMVGDSKFFDFLRRIFKKKYRPPRDRDDDDSESSESSSSSSEEDEGSLDSRDIGPIRLDPNICPEGCDREIYDKTYELRNSRWKNEQEMIEKDKLVELLRKDIDAHNKVKRKLSVQLDKRKKDLKEFMMEKQSCLNEIDQVVVLRYDQMRAAAILNCTGPQGLSNTVVFPEQLLYQLRRRVLELQEEIRLQRIRMKINRTHLFRMNIDLCEMARMEKELRAEMRDVLTRKLGRPRKVDKTLDDVLRQMARRHKFNEQLRIMPPMLAQFRKWRDRHCELEQKYLEALNHYSNRLRLAAALQADVLPQKTLKDPTGLNFGYEMDNFNRDVVRLRIVHKQQLKQIQALEHEIHELRTKPGSLATNEFPPKPPEPEQSQIYLFEIPRALAGKRRKYFPITPFGSQAKMIYDINVMKLLYDCLDTMRVSRDDAHQLLKELTALLPDILSGAKSRFEVVDSLVKKWAHKYGGDPKQYKKRTRAFDALAALADRLIREHVEAMEGATAESNKVMTELETALKNIVGQKDPLNVRLGPALAALLQAAETADLDSDETMTSLVNSLIVNNAPLSEDEIESIDVYQVMEDIREAGIPIPEDELEYIVRLAVECLQAQIRTAEESRAIEEEVERVQQELEQEVRRTSGTSLHVITTSRSLAGSRASLTSRSKVTQSRSSTGRTESVKSSQSKSSKKIRVVEESHDEGDTGEMQDTVTEGEVTPMTGDSIPTTQRSEDEDEGLTPIEDMDSEIDPDATGEPKGGE